jgi:hypothetical protein
VSNAQALPELASRHQVVRHDACLLDSLLDSKEWLGPYCSGRRRGLTATRTVEPAETVV